MALGCNFLHTTCLKFFQFIFIFYFVSAHLSIKVLSFQSIVSRRHFNGGIPWKVFGEKWGGDGYPSGDKSMGVLEVERHSTIYI